MQFLSLFANIKLENKRRARKYHLIIVRKWAKLTQEFNGIFSSSSKVVELKLTRQTWGEEKATIMDGTRIRNFGICHQLWDYTEMVERGCEEKKIWSNNNIKTKWKR